MAFPKSRSILLIFLATLLGATQLGATGGTIRFARSKCRALDTRDPAGPTGGSKLAAGTEYVFDLTTIACPLLPDGVDAFIANLTIAAPNGPGFVHMRRNGDPLPIPLTSDMNYDFNWTIANAIDIPVDAMGRAIFLAGVNDAHLIVDVAGYHADPLPAGDHLDLQGLYNSFLMRVDNGDPAATAGGIGGFATAGVGVGGYSMNNFGILARSDNATAAFFDAFLGTYGGYGQSQESHLRSGIAGALVDTAVTPIVRGFLGLDQGANNYAVFAEGNYGGTGTKFFVEPHPQRADLVIRYVALEGPEAGTYFRGRGKFQNGLATIEVPEDFRLVTDPDSLTVQVTPIGEMASVAVVRMALDRIVVRGSRNVAFSYLVNGVRKSHRDVLPVGPGSEFAPLSLDATIPLHLTPVQKEYLISNGTYNADGTVNLETARALGWDKQWKKESIPAPPKASTDEP